VREIVPAGHPSARQLGGTGLTVIVLRAAPLCPLSPMPTRNEKG